MELPTMLVDRIDTPLMVTPKPHFAAKTEQAGHFAGCDGGISPQRPGIGSEPVARCVEHASPRDGRPIASVLVELLNCAESALMHDSGKARQLIVTAAAILTARLRTRTDTVASSPASSRHSALAPWQKQRVVQFIDAKLDGPIRVQDLARLSHLSPSYFSKAFRADFKRSPHAYVVERRITRAQQLMLTTDKPLANIAAACGLSDQAHLTRLFRRVVGESPAAWRKLTTPPPRMHEADWMTA
jgi:AraC family transcriptional regulator